MTDQEKDRIECAIRHIKTAVDVDSWAVEIAVEAMKTQLSAEGTTNLQPTCNNLEADTISRQAAISELMEWVEKEKNRPWSPFNGLFHWTGIKAMLECLPSAQPDRKTGWWLIREGISDAQCSECGMYFNDVYDMENSDAFCRHCGTKMEGLKVV